MDSLTKCLGEGVLVNRGHSIFSGRIRSDQREVAADLWSGDVCRRPKQGKYGGAMAGARWSWRRTRYGVPNSYPKTLKARGGPGELT